MCEEAPLSDGFEGDESEDESGDYAGASQDASQDQFDASQDDTAPSVRPPAPQASGQGKTPKSRQSSYDQSQDSGILDIPEMADMVESPRSERREMHAGPQVDDAELEAEIEAEIDMDAIKQGGTFLKHSHSGKGKPVANNVYYVPNEQLGVVRWHKIGVTPQEDDHKHAMPVHLITHVLTGKQTPAFGKKPAKKAAPSHCFSLVSDTRTLDLEAASADEVELWVRAVMRCSGNILDSIHDSSRLVDASTTPRDATSKKHSPMGISQQQQQGGGGGGGAAFAPARPPMAMKLLKEGQLFTKHNSSLMGKPATKFVFLTTQDGLLHWCEPKEGRKEQGKKAISLGKVLSVYLGKAGNPSKSFKKKAAKKAEEDNCLSIVHGAGSLDLEAPSGEVRGNWALAIQQVIQGRIGTTIPINGDAGGGFMTAAPAARERRGSKSSGVMGSLRNLLSKDKEQPVKPSKYANLERVAPAGPPSSMRIPSAGGQQYVREVAMASGTPSGSMQPFDDNFSPNRSQEDIVPGRRGQGQAAMQSLPSDDESDDGLGDLLGSGSISYRE
jgi:hypothetical protein